MLLRNTDRFLILMILGILGQSCTEPFPIKTRNFESILVVQATLTDENIQHQVLLSRSYELEGGGPKFESNAQVTVRDDAQNTYNFQESLPGTYISTQAFAAQPGRTYRLFVNTADGHSYSSTGEQLPQSVPIDTLYAEKKTNVDNVEGVGFFVDSQDPTGKSKYYRYTYEETYKVIAPYWTSQELIIVSDNPPELELVRRETEARNCYKTQVSTNIVLANTSGYAQNRIVHFPVRFIPSDDYMLRNRYSILVKQYTQSVEAHNYLKTLAEFSGSESPFTENQPGFIDGNITSDQDMNEKVIGFFEISSLSTKRAFINFRDIFKEERYPNYPFGCQIDTLPSMERPSIYEAVKYDNWLYAGSLPPPRNGYLMVYKPCGDCTFWADNQKPDFWID